MIRSSHHNLYTIHLTLSTDEDLAIVVLTNGNISWASPHRSFTLRTCTIDVETGVAAAIRLTLLCNWTYNGPPDIDLTIAVLDEGGGQAYLRVKGFIRVEKRLEVVGELQAFDANDQLIPAGAWTSANGRATLSGATVRFMGTGVPPRLEDLGITLAVEGGGASVGDLGEVTGQFDIPPSFQAPLTITIEVTTLHDDQSFLLTLVLRIDNVPPSILGTYPDDGQWLGSPGVVIGCIASDGEGSGIARMECRRNPSQGPNGEWLDAGPMVERPAGVEASSASPLADGTWTVAWRVSDLAGNVVLSAPYNISVDTTAITFSDMSPDAWQNTTAVEVSVLVSDAGGSGVDLATVRWSVSTEGLFAFSEWRTAGLSGVSQTESVTVPVQLREGMDNFVRFTAADAVGNARDSDAYRVRVDVTPPTLTDPLPPPDVTVDNSSTVTCGITVRDALSGVVPATLAFAYRPDGGELSQWMGPTRTPGDPSRLQVEAPLAPGLDNLVVWRATDLAGNVATLEVRVRVNRPPAILSITPKGSARALEGTTIHFDATYADPDGDNVTVSWLLDGAPLSNNSTFDRTFPRHGRFQVTLALDDGHGNRVERDTTVIVEERTTFLERQRELLFLIPLAIVCALAGLYVLMRRRADKDRPTRR